jgi:hypothetical protein
VAVAIATAVPVAVSLAIAVAVAEAQWLYLVYLSGGQGVQNHFDHAGVATGRHWNMTQKRHKGVEYSSTAKEAGIFRH